jgi:hypothetical protein
MSVINVSLEDTFEQWRVKTNQLGSAIGDAASLQTTSTDLVEAINEVRNSAVVEGIISTGGYTFQVDVDGGDGAELILDGNGNLTLAGKLIASVQGDLQGNAATATKLRTGRIISITGDATWDITFDGSTNVSSTLEINPSGVTPGTYTKVTVTGDGRVTVGTDLSSSDVTDALGYTPVNSSTGYNDPTWIVGLDGGKILESSSIDIENLTLGNRLLVSNGSAAAPSIAWTSDGAQDTGFYWGGDGYTYFSNNGVKSGEIQPGGNLLMVGNVTGYSDISLKKNIETIKGALDKVNRLRGVYYDNIDTNERNIGVIAQEIQVEAPELIRVDSEGLLTVAYGNMGALLLQAINELTDRVKAIELKLN